jgi:hypothetical protein
VLVPFWRRCGRPTPRHRPALPRTRPGTLEIPLRMSKRRQGNAVLAGRISVKNKRYLQPEWSSATEAAAEPVVGEGDVEVEFSGVFGTSCAATGLSSPGTRPAGHLPAAP